MTVTGLAIYATAQQRPHQRHPYFRGVLMEWFQLMYSVANLWPFLLNEINYVISHISLYDNFVFRSDRTSTGKVLSK